MDAQRLADYLAGELDPDEHRAIEAQLARNPALRARLQRLRDADAALAGLPPADPADGFEQRLDDALAPVLRERLADGGIAASGAGADGRAGDDTPAGVPDDVVGADELARRRDRSARRASWPRAVGGVAAGLALLGVAGVAMLGLPGAQEDLATTTDTPTTESADEALGEGPVVLATDRDLDDADVASLLDDHALTSLARRDLDAGRGTTLAERYTGVLADDDRLSALHGARSAPEADDAPADDADTLADLEADGAADPGPGTDPADLDARARADIRRCLDTLLEGAQAPVPAYVEVTSYQGEPAIAFGLLGRGADGQRYERLEVWVLDRSDCQVRTFQQRDH